MHRLVAAVAGAALLALASPAYADLGVTAPSPADQAVLTWPDAGAASYEIDRSPAVAGVCDTGSVDVLATVPDLTYTDAPPDGDYCYTVIAALDPVDSGTVEVVVDTTPPAPPPVLVGALRYVNSAPQISWPASPSPDVVSYTVTRDGGAPVGVTADLTVTDTAPLADGLHTYSIVASDGLHDSTPASVTVFLDATPPDAPGSVAAAARPGTTMVDVTWEAPADPGDAPSEVDQVVVRRTDAGVDASGPADGLAVCAVHPSQTTCTDAGAGESTGYRYTAFAIDRAGNVSAPAAIDLVTPDLTAPGAVSGLRAIRHGQAVTLRWTPAADGDLARTVLVSRAGRPPQSIGDGRQVYSGAGTIFRTTQAIGHARFYAAFEVDVHGLVSPAATLTVKVPASPLRPVDGTIVRSAPRLSWKGVAGASYYDVQIWSGSVKVAEGWPSTATWRPPRATVAGGGRFAWYVWPGRGARAAARYGPEIGHARFILRP